MNVACLRWFLRGCRELEVSRFLVHLAVGHFDFLNAFIGGEQTGFRANVHSFQSARLWNFLRWIMRLRSVHHIYPDRQRDVVSERAAKNLLRLVEPSPNRAGNRAVISGEKHIGEIVSGPSFSGRFHFL
jgi:hypothetical protein